MEKPLVSVVLPIYNVEKYLDRCVQSVVDQTYWNLEILLVDDGSPDRCPQMCDAWARRDPRIKVIHKENAGLGFARNTGIENANGEYICFFDSDDYVETDTVEVCVQLARKENADLVCFGNDVVTQEGKHVRPRIPTPPRYVYAGDEVLEVVAPNLLFSQSSTGENWNFSASACFAMFSLQVIQRNGWRFVSEREIISEDIYSVLDFYQYAKKIAILPKVLYHYRENPASLSHSYRKDRYEKLKYLAAKLTELSISMGGQRQLQDRIPRIFLGLTLGTMKQIVMARCSVREKYRELGRVIGDGYMQQILRETVFSGESIPRKLMFWAMKYRLTAVCYGVLLVRNHMGNR